MRGFITILALLLLLSCKNEDSLLEITGENVVCEGWLTDQEDFQYVRLTELTNLGQSNTRFISDARIRIVGGEEEVRLVHQNGGWYQSERRFRGIPGNTYQLAITLSNGDIIRSESEIMADVPEIDSISFQFYERSAEGDEEELIAYYPIAHSTDDSDLENFYRWKIHKNDTLFSDVASIVILNDRFFNGNAYSNEFTQFEYLLNDSIRIELHEISAHGFDFLTMLKAQTTSLGAVSPLAPAPVTGNLRYINSDRKVLGFWGTASIKEKKARVE